MKEAIAIVQKMLDNYTHENCVYDYTTGVWEGGDNEYMEVLMDVISALEDASTTRSDN